jgi:nucleoside-diphosphate-sugar epimerase
MKALVTGGGGFLGRRIVELLIGRGDDVAIVARGRYPEVEALGARGIQADLRDAKATAEAVKGFDAVFHVAAKAGYWGPEEEYRSINVDATRNVVEGMRQAGVRRLVYTSTPSVIGYDAEVENGGPEIPYPPTHESPYPRTKAEAERMVRAANGPDLSTVALRPHLIIGPGDNNLMPKIVTRAAGGALPMVGDGGNKVDLTYVDNAAWAHLDACDALAGAGAPCAGKAYFISNGEPVVLWTWLNGLLRDLGCPPVRKHVSHRLARFAGGAMELAWKVLPLPGEPRLTRFLASALARSHWYDMGPAKRDFGYSIRVPMQEGTARTVAWLRTALAGKLPAG